MNQRTAPTTGTDPRTVKPPLKKQDVSLVEESVYTFDRTTGWLTLVTTELRFRAGTLSARSNTRSTVSVTRP